MDLMTHICTNEGKAYILTNEPEWKRSLRALAAADNRFWCSGGPFSKSEDDVFPKDPAEWGGELWVVHYTDIEDDLIDFYTGRLTAYGSAIVSEQP